MKYRSIIQEDTESCYFCGSAMDLHWHHVYHWSSWVRTVSAREGCMVRVCANCHNFGPKSIHLDKERVKERELQAACQKAWETQKNGSHEDFIKVFGKGYLND